VNWLYLTLPSCLLRLPVTSHSSSWHNKPLILNQFFGRSFFLKLPVSHQIQ
jgi:hypothetical protein